MVGVNRKLIVHETFNAENNWKEGTCIWNVVKEQGRRSNKNYKKYTCVFPSNVYASCIFPYDSLLKTRHTFERAMSSCSYRGQENR